MTAGQVKVWNGSAWVLEDILSFAPGGAWDTATWDVDYWAPDKWRPVPAKVWSGSVWYKTYEKPVAGPTTKILTSYTPGTDRNDFSGAVGVRLGIGTTTLNATWLGLRSNGYGGTRTVKIYEWFSGLVQQTVVVDYGAAPAGTWVWKSMPSFAFLANGYYAILMDVTAYDGMVWKNPGPATYQNPAIVNVYDSYYSGGLATGIPNSSFVGIDLGW